MAKRLLSTLVLGLLIASIGKAQATKLTPDEEKEASRIKLEYNRRMGETGRVDDLIADMFVPDVSTRWLQEAHEKHRTLSPEIKDSLGYLAAGLLRYSPQLLEKISADDWKDLNLASTIWVRAIAVAMMNRVGELKAAGKERNTIDDDAEIAKFFMPSVRSLFADDPILSTSIDENAKPIETVDEARRVTGLLKRARELYEKEFADKGRQLTPATLKALAAAPKGANDFSTTVQVSKRETYGFPAGTRFITVYASPAEPLIFVKQGADYKIVDVTIEIGD